MIFFKQYPKQNVCRVFYLICTRTAFDNIYLKLFVSKKLLQLHTSFEKYKFFFPKLHNEMYNYIFNIFNCFAYSRIAGKFIVIKILNYRFNHKFWASTRVNLFLYLTKTTCHAKKVMNFSFWMLLE
jgi:hypothetical protein